MKLNVKIGGDVNIYLTPDADPISLDICENSSGDDGLGASCSGADDSENDDRRKRSLEEAQFWKEATKRLEELAESVDEDSEDPVDLYGNSIVMILEPGKEAKVTTFEKAYDLVPGFYENYECAGNFLDMGITLFHRQNQILQIDDSKFLIGTAVVCFVDSDGDLWPMGGVSIYQVFHYMENHNVVINVGGKQMIALDITGSEPEEEGK